MGYRLDLSAYLDRLREGSRLSISELCRETGFDLGDFSRLIRGVRDPRNLALKSLARLQGAIGYGGLVSLVAVAWLVEELDQLDVNRDNLVIPDEIQPILLAKALAFAVSLAERKTQEARKLLGELWGESASKALSVACGFPWDKPSQNLVKQLSLYPEPKDLVYELENKLYPALLGTELASDVIARDNLLFLFAFRGIVRHIRENDHPFILRGHRVGRLVGYEDFDTAEKHIRSLKESRAMEVEFFSWVTFYGEQALTKPFEVIAVNSVDRIMDKLLEQFAHYSEAYASYLAILTEAFLLDQRFKSLFKGRMASLSRAVDSRLLDCRSLVLKQKLEQLKQIIANITVPDNEPSKDKFLKEVDLLHDLPRTNPD